MFVVCPKVSAGAFSVQYWYRFLFLQVSATHVGKRWQEQGRLARPWATCTTRTASSAVHVAEHSVERHSTMSMDVSTVRRITW